MGEELSFSDYKGPTLSGRIRANKQEQKQLISRAADDTDHVRNTGTFLPLHFYPTTKAAGLNTHVYIQKSKQITAGRGGREREKMGASCVFYCMWGKRRCYPAKSRLAGDHRECTKFCICNHVER